MIQKSVSGSTLILALGAMVAWPVWGWAGKDYTHINKEYSVKQGDPVIHCMTYQDKDLGVMMEGPGCPKHQGPACYQRMREAMKAANPYLVPPGDSGIRLAIPDYCFELCQAERRVEETKKKHAVMNQWEAVMKDCVGGGQ